MFCKGTMFAKFAVGFGEKTYFFEVKYKGTNLNMDYGTSC